MVAGKALVVCGEAGGLGTKQLVRRMRAHAWHGRVSSDILHFSSKILLCLVIAALVLRSARADSSLNTVQRPPAMTDEVKDLKKDFPPDNGDSRVSPWATGTPTSSPSHAKPLPSQVEKRELNSASENNKTRSTIDPSVHPGALNDASRSALDSLRDSESMKAAAESPPLRRLRREGERSGDASEDGEATSTTTLTFDAYRRVSSRRGDICVVFDYDDTFASTGAWVVNKWLLHFSLRGGDSHYQRGLAFPGIGATFYRIAEGPVQAGERRTFVRPVLPMLLSARLTENISSLFRSKWFKSMLDRTLHRGYVRWKGWRGRIGLRGFRGGNPKALWRVGYASKATVTSMWRAKSRSRNKLGEIAKLLDATTKRWFGQTAVSPHTRFVTFGDIKEDDPELFGSLVTLRGNKVAAAFLHMVYDRRPHYFEDLLKRHRKTQRDGLSSFFWKAAIRRGDFWLPSLHIDYVIRKPGPWESYDAARMPYDGTNCANLSSTEAFGVGRQLGDTLRDVIAHYLKTFIREDEDPYSEYHEAAPEMPVVFLRCRGILTGFDGKGEHGVGVSYVPADVQPDTDLGVPLITYRTFNAVAAAGYFMHMWNEVDTMRLMIDTMRDQRDMGDPLNRARRRQWADLLADVMAFKPVMDQINAQPDAFPKDAIQLLRHARDAAFAAEDFLCFARSAVDFRDIEKCRVLVEPSRKIGAKDPLYDSTACRMPGSESDVFTEEEWERSGRGEIDGVNGMGGQSVVSTFSCFDLENARSERALLVSTSTPEQERSLDEALYRQRGKGFLGGSKNFSLHMHLKKEGIVPAVDEIRQRFVSRCLTFLHWRTMGSIELMTETVIAAELISAAEVGFLARVKSDELRLDEFGKPLIRPSFLETSFEEPQSVASSDEGTTSEQVGTLSRTSSSNAAGSEQAGIAQWERALSPANASSPLKIIEAYIPSFSATVWPEALWNDAEALHLLAFTLYLYSNGKLWQTRKAPAGANILVGYHFIVPNPRNSTSYKAIQRLSLRVNHGRNRVPETGRLDWKANSRKILTRSWGSHVESFMLRKSSRFIKTLMCTGSITRTASQLPQPLLWISAHNPFSGVARTPKAEENVKS